MQQFFSICNSRRKFYTGKNGLVNLTTHQSPDRSTPIISEIQNSFLSSSDSESLFCLSLLKCLFTTEDERLQVLGIAMCTGGSRESKIKPFKEITIYLSIDI